MYTNSEKFRKANILANSLCIFTKIKEDEVIKKYNCLLEYLYSEKLEINEAINLYNKFAYDLLLNSTNNSLKEYIINKIFLDNNPFTKLIDRDMIDNSNIIAQVSNELTALEFISNITSKDIKEEILLKTNSSDFEADIVKNLIEYDREITTSNSEKAIDKLKSNIINSSNWSKSLNNIIEFYKQYGTGEFGHYRAFVWERENNKEYLRGIEKPDPVSLNDLIGYEHQKETIIENTKQFLNGHPANNILLYGSRGTGKSSTVKAIINEYYNEGLRLIEVDKNKLADFTKIIRLLKNKNLKFIIFVDDLVFEEGEASYSALKTILEGGIENRSNNILIYATTNRKHLVKETFSERSGDEVHANDAIEEKLSLADRFGITVSFYSPDQKEYIKIIDEIAEARNIKVNKDYLHAEALKWVRWYNARSPRTAVQFINWLEGNLN